MSLLPSLVLTFALLSLMSIGGANATIPEIHRQVVDIHHWMSDATFATLVAIGQTAPGPNVMIVSIIGWHLAGLAGLLLTSIAIVLPSSLIALAVGRVINRNEANDTIALVRRALAPIAVGFMLASGVVMAGAAYVSPLSLGIVAAVGTLVYFTRRSPLWGIAGGAAVGILGHRLGLLG